MQNISLCMRMRPRLEGKVIEIAPQDGRDWKRILAGLARVVGEIGKGMVSKNS